MPSPDTRPPERRSPYTLLAHRLERNPSVPWLTWIDLGAEQRIELSVASTVNAVVKVAHLMNDLGAELGHPPRVELRLPMHWQAWTISAGVWAAGGCLVLRATGPAEDPVAEPGRCDGVVVGPEGLTQAVTADTAWALSLHPLGLPFAEALPFPFEDLATAVAGQSDAPVMDGARGDLAALSVGTRTWTHSELAQLAGQQARWSDSERVLTALPWTGASELVTNLLLPAAADRSVVVLADPPTADALSDRLVETCRREGVTATAGLDVEGLPRLA